MKRRVLYIWKWISNIGNLVKTVISVITLAGVIVGGIKTYNAAVIRKHDKHIKELEQQKIRDRQYDSLLYAIKGVQAGQVEIYTSIGLLDGRMGKIESKVGKIENLVLKTATREELLNYFNSEITKKNGSYFNEIVLGPSDIWTPFVSEQDQ